MSSLPSACAVQVQGCAVHVKGGAGIGARRGDEKAAKSAGHGEAAAARRLRLGTPHHQAPLAAPLATRRPPARRPRVARPVAQRRWRRPRRRLSSAGLRLPRPAGLQREEPRGASGAASSAALLCTTTALVKRDARMCSTDTSRQQRYRAVVRPGRGQRRRRPLGGLTQSGGLRPCQAAARPATEPAAERHAPMSSPTTRHGHLALLRARGPARRPAGCGRRVAAASATQPARKAVSNVFPRAASDVH